MANLFFSEYAEGSSNNKYFEVYNPTTDTVDLSLYAYPNVGNAPSTPGVYEYWNDFDAGAVILPNDVYVVAHPSADATILAEADETFTYLSNGDDGFGLVLWRSDFLPSNRLVRRLEWRSRFWLGSCRSSKCNTESHISKKV